MNNNELKKKLTTEEYRVTQEKDTEAPFSGSYVDHMLEGVYACKVCGQVLFSSNTKLNSRSGPTGLQGWPAFDEALPGTIEYIDDKSMGMVRTEIVCSKCKSHLGHLFDDDTRTGKHFCTNSCALDFKKQN